MYNIKLYVSIAICKRINVLVYPLLASIHVTGNPWMGRMKQLAAQRESKMNAMLQGFKTHARACMHMQLRMLWMLAGALHANLVLILWACTLFPSFYCALYAGSESIYCPEDKTQLFVCCYFSCDCCPLQPPYPKPDESNEMVNVANQGTLIVLNLIHACMAMETTTCNHARMHAIYNYS